MSDKFGENARHISVIRCSISDIIMTRFSRDYSFSFKPNLKHQDIERGLHQPTKTSEYTNGHEVKASTKTIVEDDEPSRSSVYLRRSLKAIGSLIVIGGAAFVIYYFDNWLFWMAAIFVALVLVIIITGFWRWLHIAAVTAPRDIR